MPTAMELKVQVRRKLNFFFKLLVLEVLHWLKLWLIVFLYLFIFLYNVIIILIFRHYMENEEWQFFISLDASCCPPNNKLHFQKEFKLLSIFRKEIFWIIHIVWLLRTLLQTLCNIIHYRYRISSQTFLLMWSKHGANA